MSEVQTGLQGAGRGPMKPRTKRVGSKANSAGRVRPPQLEAISYQAKPAMSPAGRFCCRSPLRLAANRDSILLTRILVGQAAIKHRAPCKVRLPRPALLPSGLREFVRPGMRIP